MKGVYVFMADGLEETETITTIDMLRRGGVKLQTVSNNDARHATSSHGITILTDITFSEFLEYTEKEGTEHRDFMIFPGGMPGSTNLAANEELMRLMEEHYKAGGSVAAICAAPSVVLGRLDGLEGRKMTCYDGFEDTLVAKGAEVLKEGVVSDGRIVTGRGAGHTVAFGLEILSHITDRETADKVASSIML